MCFFSLEQLEDNILTYSESWSLDNKNNVLHSQEMYVTGAEEQEIGFVVYSF